MIILASTSICREKLEEIWRTFQAQNNVVDSEWFLTILYNYDYLFLTGSTIFTKNFINSDKICKHFNVVSSRASDFFSATF